jgi:hypothetical protein
MRALFLFTITLVFMGCGGGNSANQTETQVVEVDSYSASQISASTTGAIILNTMGFNVDTSNKALQEAIECPISHSDTINCSSGGDYSITISCHSDGAQHCVSISDSLINFNGCSPQDGLTLNGLVSITNITAIVDCNTDYFEMNFKFKSDDYQVAGDSEVSISEMEFNATFNSSTGIPEFSTHVLSSTTHTSEGVIYCLENIAGGLNCVPGQTPSVQVVCEDQNEDYLCTDSEGGDDYCSSQYQALPNCMRGCCSRFEDDVNICTASRECSQRSESFEIVVLSFVEGEDDALTMIHFPLMCVDSLWQVRCLSDDDCRHNTRCMHLDTLSLGEWGEYFDDLRTINDTYPYGFCRCLVTDETLIIESECADGIDNNGNGLTDCEDKDCLSNPYSGCITSEQVCNDGIDDDSDGLIDCDDPDCDDYIGCKVEVCDNEVDDDEDGLVDCDDCDCFGSNGCSYHATEDNCENSCDDDGDGDIDCFDSDCKGIPPCDVDCEDICAIEVCTMDDDPICPAGTTCGPPRLGCRCCITN